MRGARHRPLANAGLRRG